MAKRYYWLKLQNDFFSQTVIKKLRRIAGGDTFTIIYLKLQLLSLKNNGKLYFEGIEDDFSKELALTLDEDEENVSLTLSFLQKHGLIDEIKEDEFSLPETIENIGSETSSASRVRKHREKQKALQGNTSVTNCNTEKSREELDKEIDTTTPTTEDKPVDNFIEFFNSNMGHLMTPFELEVLQSYVNDGMSQAVITLALQEAVEKDAREMRYIKAILNRWLEHELKTIEAVMADKRNFENKKKTKTNTTKQAGSKKESTFNNYKQRDYDFNDLKNKLLGWDKHSNKEES